METLYVQLFHSMKSTNHRIPLENGCTTFSLLTETMRRRSLPSLTEFNNKTLLISAVSPDLLSPTSHSPLLASTDGIWMVHCVNCTSTTRHCHAWEAITYLDLPHHHLLAPLDSLVNVKEENAYQSVHQHLDVRTVVDVPHPTDVHANQDSVAEDVNNVYSVASDGEILISELGTTTDPNLAYQELSTGNPLLTHCCWENTKVFVLLLELSSAVRLLLANKLSQSNFQTTLPH